MTTAPTTAVTDPATLPKRIFNFSAGPAVLPEEVILQAREDIWSIFDTGIGVMEHSHRGKAFDRVIGEAEADCRAVGGVPDDYAVLFLQGGATLQFTMLPMSHLPAGRTADYIDTGVWATKALKAAKPFGTVNVAYDGSASGYDHVPAADELSLTGDAAYCHYCTNNTIYGTCFPTAPVTDAPLVADMSSDMYSRPIDIASHAMIYAGAQKNLGPAGTTLVIIRRDFMESTTADPPAILDYRQHAEKGSRLNTTPTFGVYVMGQVFKWILRRGGLTTVADRNRQKAQLIYDTIDTSGGFYRPVARDDSRSPMNVSFRTPDETLDAKFLTEAADHDMDGLKGHRNTKGLRASIYNAFPTRGCEVLSQFMKDFAAKNG
ncbi:MAG: 3-phosphoserine/phosphohydroxythreonine transaminase [Planctomycetota bacterium]